MCVCVWQKIYLTENLPSVSLLFFLTAYCHVRLFNPILTVNCFLASFWSLFIEPEMFDLLYLLRVPDIKTRDGEGGWHLRQGQRWLHQLQGVCGCTQAGQRCECHVQPMPCSKKLLDWQYNTDEPLLDWDFNTDELSQDKMAETIRMSSCWERLYGSLLVSKTHYCDYVYVIADIATSL